METKGSLQRELRLVCSPAWQPCMEDASFSNLPSSLCQHPSFSAFFSLCRSRFLNLLLLLFVLCVFSPQNVSLSFSRLSFSLCAEKKVLSLFWHLLRKEKKKQASTQIRCFPIFSLFHLTERLIYIESFFSFFFFLQINSKWSYLMSSVFQIKMEALAALRQLKHQEMNEAQPDMYHLSLIMWIFI